MKTKGIFKIGLSAMIIGILCLVSLRSFAHKAPKTEQVQEENVSVTIDSNTSSEDFEDIKDMLKEQHISASFTNIERNNLGKLTGLKIVLKDDNGNQAVSQVSSSMPISQIVFGRKDGLLYISQSNRESGAFAFFNRPNMVPFQFDNDSIMQQQLKSFGHFNFDDFFSNEDGSFFFNGKSMTLDELKEQMKNQFNSIDQDSKGFSWFFDSDNSAPSKHKYTFIDDPNSDKLIIIDGKQSNFKTLKKLAEDDKLDTVDDLKPKTAMSIYGSKAKDGAIIATTKS